MVQLEKIYKIFKQSSVTLTIIFAVLLLDKLLSLFVEYLFGFSLHTYDWPPISISVYNFIVAGSLIAGLFCWIIFLLLWLYRFLHIQKRMPSLLCEVSPEQEQKILKLLKQVAKPSDGSNKMNRAEVANFLATLKSLGHLADGGDYNNLRLWVENVTGLRDADKVHFNEAYKRALDKRGNTRYTDDLKKILNID